MKKIILSCLIFVLTFSILFAGSITETNTYNFTGKLTSSYVATGGTDVANCNAITNIIIELTNNLMTVSVPIMINSSNTPIIDALVGFTNSINGLIAKWTQNIPTSTNSTGTKGYAAYTNNYLYICVEPNMWKRCIISGWVNP
jgi:hypothetical protein